MRLLFFFLFSLVSMAAMAQTTRTWDGSTDTNWQTADNWTPSGVPASADPVIIGSTTNQPVLGSSTTVASLTVNTGAVLNLGSYTLTVSGAVTATSATINNGSLICGASALTSCTVGAKVTSSGATIQLRNCTFNQNVTVTQTGSTSTTSYGNTFHHPTRLTNTGAGFLSFGVGTGDVFNDSLVVTVTGSRAIYLAHSSSNNQFNGYTEFNKTSSGTSNGVIVGSTTHATVFKSTVLLKAAAGGLTTQNASFTNCTFESTASLNISSGNFTHGQVSFSGCRIYPSVSITTGATAQVQLTGGTIAYSSFTSVSPSILMGSVEFKSTCSLTKTGSSSDLSSGPIVCRSSNLFKNTGAGYFYLGGAVSNKFHQGLTVENTGAGTLQFTLTQATDSIIGTTSISTSAGLAIVGNIGTVNKPTISGNIIFNITGGAVQLNGIKQSAGNSLSASALSGNLTLTDFKQLGTSAINLSGTGAFTVKSGTEIRGDLSVSAGRIYVLGGEFFEEVSFTQTGTLASQGEGYPVFHKDVEFTCTGSGFFQLNYPYHTFTYNANLILNNASGNLLLGYGGTHAVKGDVIYKGAYAMNTTTNNKIVLNGTLNQAIRRENNFTPTLLRLEVNKASGVVKLETPLTLLLNLALSRSHIENTESNLLNLGGSCTVSGGADTSYVDGYLAKVGTTAFTFPTGRNGHYKPISITAPSANSTFKARYANLDPSKVHALTNKDNTINQIGTNEYWILERTSGTSNVSVTLSRDNMGCSYADVADLKITAFNGTTWKDLGQGSVTGTDSSGTITTNGASTVYGMYSLATSDTFVCVPCRADAGADLHSHPNAELIIGNNNPVLGSEYFWSPNENVYQNGRPYAFVHTTENREFLFQVINSVGCHALDAVWVTFPTNLWKPVHNHNCVSP